MFSIRTCTFFCIFILILILLVQSRFRYAMKSHCFNFSPKYFISSLRIQEFLYQLWNLKSPESLYTFENLYLSDEKRARGFLSHKIVLHFFSAAPQSPGSAPPQTTLRAQRRKCVVKYLIWSIPSPPPAANPFLCSTPPIRLSLFRPPSQYRWLDS